MLGFMNSALIHFSPFWVTKRAIFQGTDLEPTEKGPGVVGSVDRVHLRDEEGARREVKVRVERED